MTISMDKKYRTRDGREVRIYAVDGQGPYPVHGSIKINGQWEDIEKWKKNGRYYEQGENRRDLIEVKPRIHREYWVNMYPIHSINPVLWETLDDAKKSVPYGLEPIARVKVVIDCEEGEGL